MNDRTKYLVDYLEEEHQLTRAQWIYLLGRQDQELEEYLYPKARAMAQKYYGSQIYIRGLIELTNYCHNDCYYCGIRRSNDQVKRYRLSQEEILSCCENGYQLGFRTFVLQGGEDSWFTDERIVEIVSKIRKTYPDCAITLSIGEKSQDSYQKYFQAGADRYLLRQETADFSQYRKLHPEEQILKNRKMCLSNLKEIGYQTGCGMMVGAPGQSPETLASNMCYMKELNPQMVGIGPFIPHHQTPFSQEPMGSVEQTTFLLGLIRLMLPSVLLPATTSLATASPDGRERGILAGANVIMPNLSPLEQRKNYELYDHKKCTGGESAEGIKQLQEQMNKIGYKVVFQRGDYKEEENV